MKPSGKNGTGEQSHHDGSTTDSLTSLARWGSLLVLLALAGVAVVGASPALGAGPTDAMGADDGGSVVEFTTASGPVAGCTVSSTSVQTGETVTIDASSSDNVDDYQYDKYGNSAFGDFTQQATRTVTYGEGGTYNPRVKVWGGPQSEESDTATCGTVTVTEPTATPTPTPAPSPVADCTVSSTSVQAGETVTIDASASDTVDDYQYDKYGNSAFGDFTQQATRTVTYGEGGTYNPRVRVWGGPQSEESDTATCGTVTVTEPTATPTPTPTPAPSPVADCTVSSTSVQAGETVTIDASSSDNVDDYQYDKYGNSAFGDFTQQATRTVTYGEGGTYNPRVKVWGGPQSEESDTATCGTVTVTESTLTPTLTPTPTSELQPSCRTPDNTVPVNESVLLDARDTTGAERYQFALDTDASFGQATSASLTEVQYANPGTYEPRVRVTGPDGDTDVATCGEVTVEAGTVTETTTPTAVPTAVPTAGLTAGLTETQSQGTPMPTPVPTVNGTATSDSETAATANESAWFRYRPTDPGANDSVRLVAQAAVTAEDVETYGWDLDGDGTIDRRGRTLDLPATTRGETTITLLIERTNGSTASVKRAVPVAPGLADQRNATEQRVTTGSGAGGLTAVAALAGLLVFVLGHLVGIRSRIEE